MKRSLNLKIKLIIPLLLILIIVFLISSIVIIDRESNVAKNEIVRNAESFSSLSAINVIKNYNLYYESGFFKYIEIIEDLLSLNNDVIKIQILNISGKILFDSDEIQNGKYNEIELGERYLYDNLLIERIGSSVSSSIENSFNKNSLDIIQPYIDEWGRHDYSVRYIVSFSSLEIMKQEMISSVVFYSFIFFMLSFFLIFVMFNRFITSPLSKLIKGVRKMGEGHLGVNVDIKSKDEIGELANSFNMMSKDLKKSRDKQEEYNKNLEILLKQKEDFINQLSHDLKSPLSPLIYLLPVLEDKETDKSKREMFNVLNRNVNYIKNLIIKTLELAQLNSPATVFKLEKTNLSKIVEKTAENKKALITKKSLNIINNISPKIFVRADKLRLEELLLNILENSINYSFKNVIVEINAEEKNNDIIVTIKDNGIGMTTKQINNIFDEFYKADESRHDFQSSGLGMTISKRIIEKHGGKIWAESDGPGKGTTIFFTLKRI
jgi:signal transduction histidine kinase